MIKKIMLFLIFLKNKADTSKSYINDYKKLTMEIIDKETRLVKKILVYKGSDKNSGVDFIVFSSYDNETMIQTLRYSKGSICIVDQYKDNKIISRKLYKNEEKEENLLIFSEYDYENQTILIKYIDLGNKLVVLKYLISIEFFENMNISVIEYSDNSEKSKMIGYLDFNFNLLQKTFNFDFANCFNLGLKINATMNSLNVKSSLDTLRKLNLTKNLNNTEFTYDYKIFNELDEKKGIKNFYSGKIICNKEKSCFGSFEFVNAIDAECINNGILTVYSIKRINEIEYIIEEKIYEGDTKESKIAKTYSYTSSIYVPKLN